MRFRFAGRPIQDNVGSRHALDPVGKGVDRVFARIQRIDPDALFAAADEVAVFEGIAGYV